MTTQEQPKRERRPFSSEEDEMLKRLVARYGDNNWAIISSLMVNRTVRQCRERWVNSLSDNIVKGLWTDEEDMLLLQLYKENGPHWKHMEKCFPGRAQYDIRNRCRSLIKKKMDVFHFLNKRTQKETKPQKKLPAKLDPLLVPYVSEILELNV